MPLFEAIDGLGVPVMIDVGTTGIGAGMPGGDGTRLRHAHPRAIDELAAAFPGLTIIATHPGWPWVEEMTAIALHKGNVYWERYSPGMQRLVEDLAVPASPRPPTRRAAARPHPASNDTTPQHPSRPLTSPAPLKPHASRSCRAWEPMGAAY